MITDRVTMVPWYRELLVGAFICRQVRPQSPRLRQTMSARLLGQSPLSSSAELSEPFASLIAKQRQHMEAEWKWMTDVAREWGVSLSFASGGEIFKRMGQFNEEQGKQLMKNQSLV